MAYSPAPKPSPLDQVFNIMALVGNGFDMQVLSEYGQLTTTSYRDFYHFMKMKNVARDNLVLVEMEKALKSGKQDWSDVEACIENLARSTVSVSDIRVSVAEISNKFVEFLNFVVSPELLSRLSNDSQAHGWAVSSLSKFLADVENEHELKKIPFGMRKANYDYYNFLFVNFNYTPLFDNYIHMDYEQFDPVPHSTVDTNFFFDTNPRKFSPDGWNYSSSSYVETQVVHPHGYQDIPRSLLFGINGDGKTKNHLSKLAKTYWARVEHRYRHLFNETSLFIVFGSSFGITDSWWWRHIADALYTSEDSDRALLIYWWNKDSTNKKRPSEVIDLFLNAAAVEDSDRDQIVKRITVVSYSDDDERTWLNTSH